MSQENAKVKCPKCGLAGNPGEFCMNGCGRLPAQSAAGPAPAARDVSTPPQDGAEQETAPSSQDRLSAAIAKLAASAAAASGTAIRKPAESVSRAADPSSPAETCGNIWENMWEIPPPAVAPRPLEQPRPRVLMAKAGRVEVPKDFSFGNPFGSSAAEGSESPVEVVGRVPDAFVEDCTLPLQFRVMGKGESFPAARLKLCRDGEVLAQTKPESIRSGEWTRLSINFCPDHIGIFDVNIVLEGDLCGEAYESEAFPIRVYPNDLQEAKSIAVNITNEFRDIHVDRAGDARFAGSSADIASAIRDAKPGEKVTNILERCAEGVGDRRYPLHAVSLPSRLTLVDPEGFEVHVFSDRELSFGRSRDNDVVLRVFGSDGFIDKILSGALSRFHFRIRYNDLDCQLIDGGPVRDSAKRATENARSFKPSSGTVVSGHALAPCGFHSLGSGDTYRIDLAPGAAGAILSLEAHAAKCPGRHREVCGRRCPRAATASLLLKRLDTVREAYLATWKCASLEDVFPGLQGYYIVWDGDRFVVETPQCETIILRAGVEIGPSDHPVSVIPYRQFNI